MNQSFDDMFKDFDEKQRRWAEEERKQRESQSNAQAEFDFFKGCEDLDSLKKRYRDLMKTFHSDGTTGNEEIATQINVAYEKLKKQFN